MPPRPPDRSFPVQPTRPRLRGALARGLFLACASSLALSASAVTALALSTVQPADPVQDEQAPTASPIPAPDTTIPRNTDPDEAEPGDGEPPEARPAAGNSVPPEVFYGDEDLPAPVRTMRELIMEACRSGDVEALRTLLGTGADITQLSLTGTETDPIEYIKGLSGDAEGQEILAILLEVMEAGHVRMEAGTDNDIYVWPYFAGAALETLTPPQRVELFELITAGDYEDMLAYGAYIFYRVGITPDGKWQFFIAGD